MLVATERDTQLECSNNVDEGSTNASGKAKRTGSREGVYGKHIQCLLVAKRWHRDIWIDETLTHPCLLALSISTTLKRWQQPRRR